MRKHPLANCEECPLFEGTTYVPSSSPIKASLGIIGEAPGAYEIRAGKPFVGPPGKLLDIILKHHSIDRDETFLGNATSCRMPDNSAPPRSAIAACRPRLVAELQEAGVDTVVALGNTACESVLGVKASVTSLRPGPGRYSNVLPGVRIIPTIHPSATMHNPDQFPHIVADIGKVYYKPKPWVEPIYTVANNDLEALNLMDTLYKRQPKVIVVDIEVDIEKDASFEVPSTYDMLCVGLGYDVNKVLVLGVEAMKSEKVRDYLCLILNSFPIVAQNGKFDLKGLEPILGPLELYFDTMLASYTFDERPGIHGLKYMAQEYLGAPKYDEAIKPFVKDGEGYGNIPKDMLYKYNAYDVACTYALWLMFEERYVTDPNGPELRKVHDHLVRASNGLMKVELDGIGVDLTYLMELGKEFTELLINTEIELDHIVGDANYDKGGGINPRSPLQVKKYLADNKIVVDSTDVKTMDLLLTKTIPEGVRAFVTALLKHRGQAKMYSTYIKGIMEKAHENKIYPTFLLHGTTTGRLSCRNPNLQNIPRDSSIRKIFVPTQPENLFLQVDYSQAELRVLSYLAGDKYFRDIFNAGDRDVFDDLTPILYPGKRKEDMTPGEWKELRIMVKTFVYGLNYGREAASIATQLGITVQEANVLRRNFFEVIPEIVAFQNITKRSVLDGNELVTPWGRHRRFSLITKENKHNVMNEALAFLPQSTASDMCLQAMYWTVKEIGKRGTVRNIVHDSLLIEGHADDMEYLREVTSRNMIRSAEQIVGDYVKFDVDSKIGKHWGEV